MTDISMPETSVQAPLLETLKEIRPQLQRTMDLSARDVSTVFVEPVMTALGWNMRDPKQVRRPDGQSILKLLSSGKTQMAICTLGALEDVPDALSEPPEDCGEWIVVTNGRAWNIFNQRHLARPFRSASTRTASEQREAGPVLSMLARETFLKDGLTEAWMSEAVDRDVERVLARHLDASSSLVKAVQSGLREQGVTIADEDVRAALARIDIALGGQATSSEDSDASTISSDAGEPAKATSDDKTGAGKSTSGKAKSTGAKKTSPKGSSKSTGKASKSSTGAKPATSRNASKAPGLTTSAATPADADQTSRADADLPSSPDEIGWPKQATHVMHRKRNIVFINHDAKTGKVKILPRSLIVQSIGKTLSQDLTKTREDAVTSGKLSPVGDTMFEVKKPITLQSPRDAASFSAAALVKDITAWRDRNGQALEIVQNEGAPESKPEIKPEANADTVAPAEAEAASA